MISLRIGLLLCAAFAIFSACATADHEATKCGDIPTNGCPLDSTADVCADATCAAAYACNADGSWTLDHTCTAFVDGGGRDAAHPQDSGPVSDSSRFDAPPGSGGGPGCEPLQDTDCTLDTALACPSGCCDCQTLFYCDNGDWVVWGECEDDGGLVASGK